MAKELKCNLCGRKLERILTSDPGEIHYTCPNFFCDKHSKVIKKRKHNDMKKDMTKCEKCGKEFWQHNPQTTKCRKCDNKSLGKGAKKAHKENKKLKKEKDKGWGKEKKKQNPDQYGLPYRPISPMKKDMNVNKIHLAQKIHTLEDELMALETEYGENPDEQYHIGAELERGFEKLDKLEKQYREMKKDMKWSNDEEREEYIKKIQKRKEKEKKKMEEKRKNSTVRRTGVWNTDDNKEYEEIKKDFNGIKDMSGSYIKDYYDMSEDSCSKCKSDTEDTKEKWYCGDCGHKFDKPWKKSPGRNVRCPKCKSANINTRGLQKGDMSEDVKNTFKCWCGKNHYRDSALGKAHALKRGLAQERKGKSMEDRLKALYKNQGGKPDYGKERKTEMAKENKILKEEKTHKQGLKEEKGHDRRMQEHIMEQERKTEIAKENKILEREERDKFSKKMEKKMVSRHGQTAVENRKKRGSIKERTEKVMKHQNRPNPMATAIKTQEYNRYLDSLHDPHEPYKYTVPMTFKEFFKKKTK